MTERGLRRKLVLAAAGAVALGLAAVTIAFNAVLGARLSSDADNALRSRVQAGLAVVAVSHGHVAVEETPQDSTLDLRVWVFDGRRAVDRPPGPPSLQVAVADLASPGGATKRDGPSHTRLLAAPIVNHGRRIGAVVGAVSLVPYEHSENIALVSSLVLDALVLAAVLLFASGLVTRALRPVARMTAQAADWSEHDLDRRFALGPPHDELTALAATLDGLLGRLSASLRHEQRFSAELAHELRTPLAQLRSETEVALRGQRAAPELREALEAVLRYTERMTAVVDALMTAAQREADPHTGTVEAAAAVDAAAAACGELAKQHGVSLAVSRPRERIEVDAEAELTTQILVPLLENALRYSRSAVRLTVSREGEAAVFRVTDDGPGVRAEELEWVFEPGVRGSAANGKQGAGLGLALARRLARSAGGEVFAEAAGDGGLFGVRLPAS